MSPRDETLTLVFNMLQKLQQTLSPPRQEKESTKMKNKEREREREREREIHTSAVFSSHI
jgi:hypothetical protein